MRARRLRADMGRSDVDAAGMSARHPRALYVVPKLPVSLAGGWSLRSVANLAALAKIADVDLLGIRQWADLANAAEFDTSARGLLTQYCAGLQFVNPTTTSTSLRSLTRRLRRRQALMSAFDVHPEIARRVTDAYSEYDIVWLEGTFAAQYAPLAEGTVLTLIDTHNVESEVERQFLRQSRKPVDVARSAVRLLSIRDGERRYLRHADAVIATSERDASAYRQWVGIDRVEILPNAVDAARYAGLQRDPVAGSVLFVGSLDYFPNRNGLRWFLKEVWSRVMAEVPHAHLHIVGDLPKSGSFPKVDGVTFTGGADVLDQYLERAELSICPLLEGGGTRLKVIEALAAGIPVVATSKGVEGLAVSDGDDVLVANDPAAFARAVVAVLSDPSLATSLAQHGQQTVARRYTWDTVDRVVRDLALRRLQSGRVGAFSNSGALER